MSKRINVVLPEATILTIDTIAKPGERSRFIDHAVQHFVRYQNTEALRSRLESAAIRDRDLDREIAGEWLAADEQAWQQLDIQERKKPATRSVAKSTSRRSIRR